MNEVITTAAGPANANAAPPVFDPTLIEEAQYEVALSRLLDAVEQGQEAAYDRVAREFPRYAAPLLEAALIALPVARRQAQTVRDAAVPYAVAQAVDAGVAAARRRLGLPETTPAADAAMRAPTTLSDERKARNWTLKTLARRLHLPDTLTLKLERGQIRTWSDRLVLAVADAFEVSRAHADSLLAATAGSYTAGAAAYVASGTPESALVAERRGAPGDWETEFARVQSSLSAEQAAWWDAVRGE